MGWVEDLELLKPFPVPLTIVGAKYDLFQVSALPPPHPQTKALV